MRPCRRRSRSLTSVPYPVPLVVAFLSLAACGGDATTPVEAPADPDPPPVPAEATAWIERNAIPFEGSHLSLPNSDIGFLRDIVGDARVVSLGENTHGTRDFFEMKARILRFLVEEMGVRRVRDRGHLARGQPARRLRAARRGRRRRAAVGPVFLDVEHRVGAGDDRVDARAQRGGQRPGLLRVRHAVPRHGAAQRAGVLAGGGPGPSPRDGGAARMPRAGRQRTWRPLPRAPLRRPDR